MIHEMVLRRIRNVFFRFDPDKSEQENILCQEFVNIFLNRDHLPAPTCIKFCYSLWPFEGCQKFGIHSSTPGLYWSSLDPAFCIPELQGVRLIDNELLDAGPMYIGMEMYLAGLIGDKSDCAIYVGIEVVPDV